MEPIPTHDLRREDVVLHRALDRQEHLPPLSVPTAIPSHRGQTVAPVPVAIQETRARGEALRAAGHETRTVATPATPPLPAGRTNSAVADPRPGETSARSVPSSVPAPPAVGTSRVATIESAEAKASSTVRDPTPVPTAATRAPASTPAGAATQAAQSVTDPTPPPARSVPFFDLSKVVHLDGPVTFRSPGWH